MSYVPPKYDLLGVGISRVNLESAAAAMLTAVVERRKGYITVTGVHGVIEARDDPKFCAILNGSFLTTPDGMPTVWCGIAQGYYEMSRVYGPDLMLRVFEAGQRRLIRHFLYGGREGVAEQLSERLLKLFPDALIVGKFCPPFRPLNQEENVALQKQIRDCRPDILWVGLSTPKQEHFMAEYLDKLDVTLMVGVGAAFDFHAGLAPQAPRWMQRGGLEWLFRLCTEPKRLWKRYCVIVPRFILLAGWKVAVGFLLDKLPSPKLRSWFARFQR